MVVQQSVKFRGKIMLMPYNLKCLTPGSALTFCVEFDNVHSLACQKSLVGHCMYTLIRNQTEQKYKELKFVQLYNCPNSGVNSMRYNQSPSNFHCLFFLCN